MTHDLTKMMNTPVSELPDGATGYQKVSEEQFLNDLADETDVQIIDADDFLASIHVPGTYSLPRTLNTLEWWDVFNQGSIGSCLGCSDCQTATGVTWLKTGKRIEFSKFGHYVAVQLMADLKGCRPTSLGQDRGSIPTMALIVAGKWGYCPEVWSDFLETMFVETYGKASRLKDGQPLCPAYPRSYNEGLRAFGKWLEDVKNPKSLIRAVMAMFKMDKYIKITKAEQIIKAKRVGAGFVQQSSIWPKDMDAHPTRVDTFSDSKDPSNKHSGGHAYQILDITPDNEFVIGNTWGQGWGSDDGAKTASAAVEQQIIDDPMSLVYLKTDMPFIKGFSQGPREIPYKSESWG